MEIIKSQDNKKIKHIAKLKQKKYRDEFGQYLVEGYKNVLDSIDARPDLSECVVLAESAYLAYGEKFSEQSCIVVSDAVFEKLSDTQSAQGIICVNKIPDQKASPVSDRIIYLDRVRDPGNVGTILRSAVASGYDVVLDNCADPYSPKVVRSAMSAVTKCNIYTSLDIHALKELGYEIITADMNGDNVFSAAHKDKYCIVVGNEADGVRDEIISVSDRRLAIPQDNMESLNAGVAAGIMMFALRYVGE